MASSKNIISETDKKTAQKAYKVFVSSTYRDNEERRRIVQEAITMAGMVWHGMEIFTASTSPTVEECLCYAREADLWWALLPGAMGGSRRGMKNPSLRWNATRPRRD